ncbi:MAG: hypothetical protein PUC44_01470 [Eubacteriales bacterium]|nr:hypothetical protein [Eubacteriales bacterium]
MRKRNRYKSPRKRALREMMTEFLLKKYGITIKDSSDLNCEIRDMMSILLEGVMDKGMSEDLGYSIRLSQ